MKLKTTNTAIRNGYNKIVSIGYCEAYNLLKYQNPFAYNAGVYGWNCDFYDVNGVCISTGYRTLSAKNTKCPYALVERYNGYARTVQDNYDLSYEEKVAKTNEILKNFINEVI